MYRTTTQGLRVGDFLKHEYDNGSFYCREVITVAAGLNLKTNTVMGTTDAGTTWVEYDDAAPDGVVAGAILLEPVNTLAGAVKTSAIVRGPAIIARTGLVWKAGLAAPAKLAAEADLIAKGFKFADEIVEGFTKNPNVSSLV
jgi:hypothetical protein